MLMSDIGLKNSSIESSSNMIEHLRKNLLGAVSA